MKANPLIVKMFFVVLAVISMGLMYVSFLRDPYSKRIEWTTISLHLIRDNIQTFKDVNQRYPTSLKELSTQVKIDENGLFHKRENKEYISSKNGCDDEYSVLNNKGGWYYNKQTGEIKININKPLKKCFKDYYYLPSRNRVPSEW
ncbi:hypothetical protein STSP2_00350 [Anaerohalosphaera lusitana]|uniref:Uncharacterized protein n=1 Tax=Anaerohalosphaera lusitana TaxID=1936003 RepID=A0A1U9NHG1_9BACT|nr:hypothetical protein [Anaerohalosphaera lusitana]AQT67207.1 hypothetical protein STSP2_00350 [Anaerohalosphaera lusitana]